MQQAFANCAVAFWSCFADLAGCWLCPFRRASKRVVWAGKRLISHQSEPALVATGGIAQFGICADIWSASCQQETKMTAIYKTLTLTACLAFAAGATIAQDAEIDVNGDGMYSFPELQAVMPDLTADAFTVMDVSGDGLLDAEEIAAGTEAGLLAAMDG